MPDVPGADAASLLDSAEDIVNAVAPDTLADVLAEEEKGKRKWWRRRR
jgi:hypothetical protein